MGLRVPHALPQQALALCSTNPENTVSPLPALSMLFLSLPAKLLSEWDQEPNSLRAHNVEGSPHVSTQDPGTHLPGEVWPQGRQEGPSAHGLCSGRPLRCVAGPGSAAGNRWQKQWLCGGAGDCEEKRVLCGRSGPQASFWKGMRWNPTLQRSEV